MEVFLTTRFVEVGVFTHDRGEPRCAVEWWEAPCVAFTTHGSWEVRTARGGGELGPSRILVGAGHSEFDCRHPDGLDDRVLSITYRQDVDPGAMAVVAAGPRLHRLRRSLLRAILRPAPDHDEADALAAGLLDLTRSGGEAAPSPGRPTSDAVARIRDELTARHTDPHLRVSDVTDAARFSRTRLIHAFSEIVGVTPHRYLTNLRTAHAARLLVETRLPVVDICFASGFGSMSRFHAAFRESYGLAPGRYRARNAGRRPLTPR